MLPFHIIIQIGKRLQTVRENSGYTQEAFAETLNIGVEHYRKIELGMYGLQRKNMLILYKKYKIDSIYLLTGEKNYTFDVEMFLVNCSREERTVSKVKSCLFSMALYRILSAIRAASLFDIEVEATMSSAFV